MKASFKAGKFQFHLGRREKLLLLEILKLYPRIPATHHQLSKSAGLPDAAASQRLLLGIVTVAGSRFSSSCRTAFASSCSCVYDPARPTEPSFISIVALFERLGGTFTETNGDNSVVP